PESFKDFAEAVEYVRRTSAGFGRHTQAQWEALTRNAFLSHDGGWVKHYDLRIAEPIMQQTPLALQGSEAILWAAYESIRTPILLVRGQESDLLSSATAHEMLVRIPIAATDELHRGAHAPSLIEAYQIQPDRDLSP